MEYSICRLLVTTGDAASFWVVLGNFSGTEVAMTAMATIVLQ